MALVVVGSSAMTVYLWHFTALALVALGALALDLPLADVGSVGWWLAKPIWILTSALVLAGLIRAFRRFEAPWRCPTASRPAPSSWPASSSSLPPFV